MDTAKTQQSKKGSRIKLAFVVMTAMLVLAFGIVEILAPATPGVLKEYTMEEVATHNSTENGFWITYQDKVYDITDYIDYHPGGNVMSHLGGKAIDDEWKIYAFHEKGTAIKILDQFLIGTLKPSKHEALVSDAVPALH